MHRTVTGVAASLVLLASGLLAAPATTARPAPAPSASSAAPLTISVSGHHFVDAAGHVVRLLGVDHPSLEYACADGYAYDDGQMTDADAAAIASWHANAVRVPLNEDCWLGINGQPNSDNTGGSTLTVQGYRAAVEAYVHDLNAHGLYAVLDLHWTAPAGQVALEQQPMPDDHSAAFWTSVATQFSDDPAVVFDAFNEPYSPAQVDDPSYAVSWDCWRDGGCTVPAYDDSASPTSTTYTAVGMQSLVDAIRDTGARQPILLGGLGFANDLSGWVAHEPSDPLHQLAASFHNYPGEACDSVSCWSSTIASVSQAAPVVTGEFDQDTCHPSTFDADYMRWADAHGVSYLAWGWILESSQEIESDGCSVYVLIKDARGTPYAPNGTNLHAHLLALAHPAAAQRLLSLTASVSGRLLHLRVAAVRATRAAVSARTVASYGRRGHRRPASLGRTHVSLRARHPSSATLHLPAVVRQLLAHGHAVPVRVTVALGHGVTARRTVRLHLSRH